LGARQSSVAPLVVKGLVGAERLHFFDPDTGQAIATGSS
jgi:hypothetical protein